MGGWEWVAKDIGFSSVFAAQTRLKNQYPLPLGWDATVGEDVDSFVGLGRNGGGERLILPLGWNAVVGVSLNT